MQNARLDEAQAGIKIAGRNINNLKYADDTTLMAESEEELKNLLKVKEKSKKVGLQVIIQNLRSWHSIFIANRWGNTGNSDRLYFSGLQNHHRWWQQPWNQKKLAPWKKSYDQPQQHIKKQTYFADKCLYSQSYGFSSSHVWMWVGP